jgi:very-short-patch-repair endonuclease
MKFGRWTVLEVIQNYKQYKTYCKCQCSCEKQTVKMVYKNSLLNGESKSCGCLCSELKKERARSNRVGDRFGSLVVKQMLYRYRGEKTYCICDCDCGTEHICSLSNLTTGHTTSCGCVSSHLTWDGRRTDLVGKRFGSLVVTEMLYGYKHAQTYCRCKCDCGNESIVLISNLKYGRSLSCGCMEGQSVGERLIKDILISNQVNFVQQKRFDDCRNTNPLPFDFYLPDYNVCIEFDGIQHFKPIEYFGGENEFEKRKTNDLIKTQYCEKHKIRLIRLPYTLSNEEIYQNILNIWNP